MSVSLILVYLKIKNLVLTAWHKWMRKAFCKLRKSEISCKSICKQRVIKGRVGYKVFNRWTSYAVGFCRRSWSQPEDRFGDNLCRNFDPRTRALRSEVERSTDQANTAPKGDKSNKCTAFIN